MNPILAVLFGGQTKTELKDLTKAKDVPPILIDTAKKLADRVRKVSPLLGSMLDMEVGFLQLDGTPTRTTASPSSFTMMTTSETSKRSQNDICKNNSRPAGAAVLLFKTRLSQAFLLFITP